VDEWIASKDIAFYRRGIALLPERWEKVENGGNYFDEVSIRVLFEMNQF